jgi:nitric oxide dioxygenase
MPGAPAGLISNYLHDRVRSGDVLDIGPPCGEFTLDPERVNGRPVVLLAGGIGVTPLLSMLKSLGHRRITTPVHFIHAVRNSKVHALAEEARHVSLQRANVHVHFRYDAPLQGDLQNGHCDSTGIVDLPFLQQQLPGPDCEFYVCGPRPFMACLQDVLKTWGVEDERLHFEFFGPKQQLAS